MYFFPGLFLAQMKLYDPELLEMVFSHPRVTKLGTGGGRSMRYSSTRPLPFNRVKYV